MKKLFLFIFILSISSLLQAQWNKIPELSSRDIYTVYFEGNSIYAGGDSLIFISDDSGLSWRSYALSKEKSVSITDIIEINNTLFASTLGDGVFLSGDNGASWQQYNDGLGSWGKYAVEFLPSGDSLLFLATDGGGVYFMNLKPPSKWHAYNDGLPSNYAWTVIALCSSKNNLIAAAGQSGFYYLRPFGSPEWLEKTLHPVKTPNTNALAAFGDTVFAATTKGIYRSYDGGYSWDSVGIYAMPLRVTHFAKDRNRIYAGYNRGYDFFIWYSDDMGKSWKVKDHQFEYLYNFYIYNNRLWAATMSGLLYNSPEPSAVHPVKEGLDFSLGQNYPNPFNPSTSITFSLQEESPAKLTVYDLLGREIAVLLDKKMNKGTHTLSFNASSMPSGIYLYRLSAGRYTQTRKMTLLK